MDSSSDCEEGRAESSVNGKHCEIESSLDAIKLNGSGKSSRWNSADHPGVPKAPKPPVGKRPDGTWGPLGLYGGRVKETKLISVLRDVVKPSRLKRVEEVLMARSQRVQCLFENLSDPANGAACLRTMEGFGLLEAHAVESYEPFRVSGGITMNADKVRQKALKEIWRLNLVSV